MIWTAKCESDKHCTALELSRIENALVDVSAGVHSFNN